MYASWIEVYGAYLFSKSANSIFKILIDICPFKRDDFENRFFKNYSKTSLRRKMYQISTVD